MTALSKYDRLEATGLWRASPQDQRREVVVCIGNATLVIKDLKDQAITHWSLAAVTRGAANGDWSVFHPEGDTGETLELAPDEQEMVAAIETLRQAVSRARPKPGRLRWLGAAVSIGSVAALLIFWLPGALIQNALNVVPAATRAQIGDDLLRRITRVAGQPCISPQAAPAIKTLATRTGAADIAIFRSGLRSSIGLPGGRILLNSKLVEDYEEPDVAAGYILAERVRFNERDPLDALLSQAGLRANISLLTTGKLPAQVLDAYAEHILLHPRDAAPEVPLLQMFEATNIRSTPYAYALDITGEDTIALIEGDPMANRITQPLLRDADWLRLQAICGG